MKLENFFIKKNNGTIESHCEEQIIASTYSLVIRNRFTLVGTIWDPSIYTCFGLGYQLPFHQGYSTIGVIESSDMQGKFSVGDKVLYSPQFSKYTCVGISELQKNNIVKINCNIDEVFLLFEGYRADIQTYAAHKPVDKDAFSMKIGNRTYTDKKEAGAALIDMCRSAKQPNMAVTIGEYQGFKMSVSFDSFFSKFTISLKGSLSHEVEIGADPLGNLQRLSNALEGMTGKMADVEQKLSNVEHQLETAKVEVTKPFAQEQELAEKLERLAELNALLNMDEKGDNALDMGDDEPEDENGEQSAQTQESEPNRAEDIQAVAEEPLKPVASFLMSERIAEHDKERMLADGSRGRVSVKEKLAEMKQKISDQKMPEKPETVKSKGKEESL